MSKPFAERRAERIAEMQAAPLPPGSPPRVLALRRIKGTSIPTAIPKPGVQLHTVGRSVLLFAVEALLEGDSMRRQVAARLLQDELDAGIITGGGR